MQLIDFSKSCIIMSKGGFEPSIIVYVCYLHMVPGNGCNGCFIEMCGKAQIHFKG